MYAHLFEPLEVRCSAGTRRAATDSPPNKPGCSWEYWRTTSYTCSGNTISAAQMVKGSIERFIKRLIKVGGGKFMWFQPSLGSTLPGCLRARATEKLRLTGGSAVRYAQKPDKIVFFGNAMAVLPSSDLARGARAPFWGSGEPALPWSSLLRTPK